MKKNETANAFETMEIELSDEDILDAMTHIPGYLDITTEDFRAIYHLAYRHALERIFSGIQAGRLMRTGMPPLAPGVMLDEAVRILADSGYKGLAVVDGEGRVMGMMTETDLLRRLEAGSFVELLRRVVDGASEIDHRCHETSVGEAMTSPAVTVAAGDGFREILSAFRRHAGRSMPVVDDRGRLCGLLLRKDFLSVLAREGDA